VARFGPLAIIEGYYLAQVLDYFLRNGALDLLRDGATADEVATHLDRDRMLITVLLEFAVEASGIVERDAGGRYQLNARYRAWSTLGFQLDKFVGAYGASFTHLDEATIPTNGDGSGVDRTRLAAAYGGLDVRGPSLVGRLLGEWSLPSLLDLGCGMANLLMELARANGSFRGWGIDRDDAMCRTASARIGAAGLGERVSIWQCPVEDVTALDAAWFDDVSAIHAGSVLNEFFWPNGNRAVRLVADLQHCFPDRLLFVSDYYGRLTHRRRIGRRCRHAMLQDVAQAISGQGVPPPDLAGWVAIYVEAGATLLHATEGEHDGIRWFLHVVRLGSVPTRRPSGAAGAPNADVPGAR